MNGACKDRIDLDKALRYYRLGAKRKCPKCSLNLAMAYEEGMGEVDVKTGIYAVLSRDLERAEKYYKHAIALADDVSDFATQRRASKDLAALYITSIKLSNAKSCPAARASKRLRALVPDPEVFEATLSDVHCAIGLAVRGRGRELEKMLGDHNAQAVTDRARKLLKARDEERSATELAHLFGDEAVPDVSGGHGGEMCNSVSQCGSDESGIYDNEDENDNGDSGGPGVTPRRRRSGTGRVEGARKRGG
jgi:hypothetical protein